MHKLLNYVNDELHDIEKKIDSGNSLSYNEIQYADTLAHFKKNLLTADAMENSSHDASSSRYPMDRENSYRKDSMGRYSREGKDDDELKRMLRAWMEKNA